MRRWTESEWEEWRAERAAIMLIDGGYSGPNIHDMVASLEALERLRVRCESMGLKGAEAETPMPKQMEIIM